MLDAHVGILYELCLRVPSRVPLHVYHVIHGCRVNVLGGHLLCPFRKPIGWDDSTHLVRTQEGLTTRTCLWIRIQKAVYGLGPGGYRGTQSHIRVS